MEVIAQKVSSSTALGDPESFLYIREKKLFVIQEVVREFEIQASTSRNIKGQL